MARIHDLRLRWTGGVAGYVTVGVGDAAPVGWEVTDDDVDWITEH